MKKGFFITIEGCDGSGKTTQWDLLKQSLNQNSNNLVFTREPGSTDLGKELRKILLNREDLILSAEAELLLYLADRVQHIKEIIRPALEQGKTIICDRFFDSTIAYQGYARGLSIEKIVLLNNIITENLKPDLTIFLDVDPNVSLSRSKDKNKIEFEGLEFQKKVREGFLSIAKTDISRFEIINTTNLSIEEVHIKILELIKKKSCKNN